MATSPFTAVIGQVASAQQAKTAGRMLGLIAVIAFPAWSGFDWFLEPEHARVFLLVRLLGDVPMGALLWVLWRRPPGQRRANGVVFAILAIPQVEIAWMVPQTLDSRAFYVLGLTVAIYGSGCLMPGRPGWSAALIATTAVALGVSFLTSPELTPARELLASTYYVATASLIGLLTHVMRYRLGERELRARAALEREQARTEALLDQLDRLSHEDSLTGLANRRRWDSELETACGRARDSGAALAVILIDVDRFKQNNDHHGHEAGDAALREVASMLDGQVQDAGLVARLGGDELAVLLPGRDAPAAADVAERIRRAAPALHGTDRRPGPISLSLGVAAASGPDVRARRLMKEADAHLYRAKQTRNAVSAAHLVAPRQEASCVSEGGRAVAPAAQ